MTPPQANATVYGQALVELGRLNPRIVAVDADNSKTTQTSLFRDTFPERFFNCGAAEENMICVAAGLAASGKIAFASTLAAFASLRAAEPVRASVACPRLNVKLVATSAGIENAGDGAAHQAIEDLAIMRSLPNLIVLSPSDPVTTAKAVLAIAELDGPVYLRLGSQPSTEVHSPNVQFQIGRMIPLRAGKDLAIIATGNMVHQALLAANALAEAGVQARVLDCHSIKPIDREAIFAAAAETHGIVTAEDHSIVGGLGSAVCEVVAEFRPTWVKRVGLRDVFAGSGREPRKLLAHHGMDAAGIQAQAEVIWRARGTLPLAFPAAGSRTGARSLL